ncbi:putative hydroxymethylpyrimidine transporter CytX [Proteocatella sphenisci]|uniref:putative hydroxymethylpyrimidine transporter CytX n=1 Tax=Proteocatella sphenisci TaxID=181070 RepID=UPI00048FCD35|nr:putative hydroxymethylpyrimidine transporter CytX [Proteocatella sphenisci]
MEETKTSVFSNGLIWFGAAVSIAEILTGTLFAPLGFEKGIATIIIGHIIGCILLYFAGLIGAKTERSSMETVKISFGQKGSLLFSSLNVLQLVGWTAVMIVSGASAANAIVNIGGIWVWSIVTGALIILWCLIGIKNLKIVNIIAMGGLFILTIILSSVIFGGDMTALASDGLSFGNAIELSIAMPLSWLPLISDYTRNAKKKKVTAFTCAAVYFFASCWMYIIGMGAAILTGESDIAKIMMSAGLGLMGIMIIIFSTVTTTFLDVYSAGVSSVSISKKINEKWAAIIISIIGTLLAIFAPISKFEGFLYLISSVFAPMIAIQITDVFILKKDHTSEKINISNMILWAVGFAIYRIFMGIDTPIGNTIPVMIIISLLSVLINRFKKGETQPC